jgi:hypothetical protein
MGDAAFPLSQSGIDGRLAHMRDQGGQQFDAAGWHYLNTLAQRAAAHEGSVRRMLDARLERALAAFSERFTCARSACASLLAATCKQHPDAAVELERLFARGDFQRLRRLRAALAARSQCAGLAELVSRLEPPLAGAPGHLPAHQAASRLTAAAPALELKTVRESRATWARLSVDRELALAMKQGPKNAGPINSHMLVLRSLAMMQEISPDYLSRMVSYADTLLSLQPGDMEAPVKRKKSAAAKMTKKTKTKKT